MEKSIYFFDFFYLCARRPPEDRKNQPVQRKIMLYRLVRDFRFLFCFPDAATFGGRNDNPQLQFSGRYSSARSVHSLHRPYENAEPAGIRPIAKRFSMAGCRNSSAG